MARPSSSAERAPKPAPPARARRGAAPLARPAPPEEGARKAPPGAAGRRPGPVAISREPIFEAIAKRLREDLLRGVYPPRTPLRLQELADRFGTSLMPVREALHRLTAEGLLLMHPRRGAVVAEFDLDEAREILELRRLLMSHAARLAVARITPADLKELEQITGAIDASIAEQPLRFERYLELNERFHALLCERSGNRHLERVLRSYDVLGRVSLVRYFRTPQDLGRLNAQHRQILEAFRRRDGEAVERLVAEHFDQTLRRLPRSPAAPAGEAPR